MPSPVAADPTARLAPTAAAAIRTAIRWAGGREVCFACTVDASGIVQTARVVARGDAVSVLALPGFGNRGEMLVHNHPSDMLEPSGPDIQVASRIHDDGIGFGIVDNDGGVGLLEAGTGVGKSLGYLVPALRWAASNNERTVVSTNTINLQEQLVGKDLPFLARALQDQPVRFALLKGWRNYLCLARLAQARASGNALFEDSLQDELSSLQAWSERTRDGTLSDLPTPPRPELWDEVAAEPDLCSRAQCSFYNECFLFKARKEAAHADVIVVNHHLLLSDVAVRRVTGNWGEAAVLPAYTRLVIDEGHHLEDAAASHLGVNVSRRSLQRLFNRLDRRGRGLLPALIVRLSTADDLLSTASLDLVHSRLTPAVEAARGKSSMLFDLLELFLQNSGEAVVRLTDDFAEHSIWRAGLRVALTDTIQDVEMVAGGLQLVYERFEGSGKRLDDAVMPLMNEMRAVTRRLQNAADGLRQALDPERTDETIRWIEARGREKAVSVSTVPLDLAPILREDLFKRAATTIVTSATLATDGRFDFLTSRLGLDDPELEPRTGIYPSPFKYREQAVLAVPTDIPAPNVDGAKHFDAFARVVVDVASAADGGMFVLFTSHRDVRAMAAELRARGRDAPWPLLVHGDEARDVLLDRFRGAGKAILLGTASFWEGVDVPGDALRALVIAKLPFRVPTEPITAAHCEAIQANGGDPFRDYMLPHASLRLKQGFGRLIRTSADRGIVVIADPRVVTKNYGRGMIAGLPPARRIVGRWDQLKRQIQDFYLNT